ECSTDEHLQVLRYSSRCAYDSSTVHPDLLAIVSQACDGLASVASFNLVTFYKSLYYVVQVAAKNDDFHSALRLLSYLSSHISKCHNNAETSAFIKSLYQLAWNLSLRTPDAIAALKLQRHALIFLLTAVPDSINKVVSLVTMAASSFSRKCKNEVSPQMNKNLNESGKKCEISPAESKNNYEVQLVSFYHQILLAVFAHTTLSKKLIPSDIVDIITLLSSCKIHEHLNILKYSLKTFKSLCGQVCYSAVYTGLQTLLSALQVRHCGAPAHDLVTAVGVVTHYRETIIVDAGARKVALQCLLAALDSLEDDSQDASYVPVSIPGLDQILSLVLCYITPDAEVSVKLKVVGSMERWYKTLVAQLNQETVSSVLSGTEIMQRAATWSTRAESSLRLLLPLDAEAAAHYHNLGVVCGNLGVLCFRAKAYTSAAACLGACVDLQDLYCTAQPHQLSCMSSSIHKKRSVLCEAHRHSENFSAAGSVLALQVLHYAAECTLLGTSSAEVPYDSLFSLWFKLKREAVKANSSALQGVVVWTLVQAEVVRHPNLRPPSDLQVELLTREYNAAACTGPGVDCSAEQLQCAQLLFSYALNQLHTASVSSSSSALQLVVRALIMCAQVAYFKPEVSIPKAFSPDALKTETLRACCPDDGQSVTEPLCCSWSQHEGCPALYLLSFALSICNMVGSVSPFDATLLLQTKQLTNLQNSSKSVSTKSPKSARTNQNMTERSKRSSSKTDAVKETATEMCIPAEWLETCADLHFWLMMALQQLQKITKKQDEVTVVPSSLTAAAADLGDEQQPDDVCDVRSNTAALLYNPLLLHSAAHLHQALHCWQLLMVGIGIDGGVALAFPTMVCRAIAAVGHFCVLHGRTVAAVLSWKLLLHFSTSSALHSYKLKACCELVWSCPELLESCVAEQVQTELSDAGCHDINTVMLAQVALAYYHFCRGQEREGWRVLQGVLKHEVVVMKKTVRATEVQCLAHYTASLYSFLPPKLLGGDPPLNPVAVALIAAREALALTHTALDVPELHWYWRVSWLHQMTSAYLGRLALLTAQPRLARAYLKAPLAAAHQDVLPYRAAVAIALLAEVDLMCDQLDDCRVKVDTLLVLLSRHLTRSVQALDFSSPCESSVLTPHNLNENKANDATPLTTGSRINKSFRKLQTRNDKENTHVKAVCASMRTVRIEAMRQARSSSGENSPDDEESKDKFVIVDAQNKLGTQWIAIKSRLKFLSLPSTKISRYALDGDRKTCPDSPSLGHREAALHLPPWRSPYEHSEETGRNTGESCVLDAYFPLLCEVYLNTGAMLTSYHRLGARWQAAQDTVDRVCGAYDQMKQDVNRHCRIITAILGTDQDAESNAVCATNALILGWCSSQRSALQVLVARDRWTEALQLSNAVVSASASLPPQSVWRHHSHLLPLLRQTRHLLNAHHHLAANTRDGTRALTVPLASPVACPTVGLVTPHYSPVRSQRPPPLHRAPLFYPRSPRQHEDDSCNSDEATASDRSTETGCDSDLDVQHDFSSADLKNRLVKGKQRQAPCELSDSDVDDAAAFVDVGNCNQKPTKSCGKTSTAAQGNARTRLHGKENRYIPLKIPKIVVIPESPENDPHADATKTEGDYNLLDVQKKLSEIVLDDHSSDNNSTKSRTSSSRSCKSGSRSQRKDNNSSITINAAASRTRGCASSKKIQVSGDAADASSNKPKKTVNNNINVTDSDKEITDGPRTGKTKTNDRSNNRTTNDSNVLKECAPVSVSVRRGRSRVLRSNS
ncbi:hypothetical protein FHG87_012430, partial [Trinorchestia longiramus]